MAITKSVRELTADAQGNIAQDFMRHTPYSWAKEHMTRRYGHAMPLDTDGPTHPARICYDLLFAEHKTLLSWFQHGKLSVLLQGRHAATIRRGPLRSGFGWDFRDDGAIDPCMIQFKTALISAARTLEALPENARTTSNLTVLGAVNMVRDAYRTRASTHPWRAVERVDRTSDTEAETVTVLNGAELCNRWVAFQTFNFLLTWIHDTEWCWMASKAATAIGPVDDYPLKADRL